MDTLKTAAAPLPAPMRRADSGKWPLYLALALLLGASAGVVAVRTDNALYVLVGLVGLLTFIVSVVSAEFGLLLLIFLAYTRFSDIAVHTYGAISVLQVFMVLQAVAILLRWAVSRRAPTGW